MPLAAKESGSFLFCQHSAKPLPQNFDALLRRSMAEDHFHIPLGDIQIPGQQLAYLIIGPASFGNCRNFNLQCAIRHSLRHLSGVASRNYFNVEHQTTIALKLSAQFFRFGNTPPTEVPLVLSIASRRLIVPVWPRSDH